MVGAQADTARQQLLIRADQDISQKDLTILLEQIDAESHKLEYGWAAALDLRGVWISDPYFYERIKQLQTSLIDHGAGKIGTLIDSYVMHILLGQAGMHTRANVIARRFYKEDEWKLYLEDEGL